MNSKLTSNKTLKDIVKVAISNIVKLLSGVLVAFLLPKVIGVTDYGYYKTFTLYATYVGLFHFGLSDGIYLKYGGYSFHELEKTKIRLYTLFFIIIELLIATIAGIIAISFFSGELKFIFICLAVYIVANNISGYYQTLSQAIGRFNELSIRNIIQSALTAIAVFILWLIHKYGNCLVSYKIFTLVYVSIFSVLAIWYMVTYREITFGKTADLKNEHRSILGLFKIGFPLLVANLVSSLILTLDRQFVNILFDTNTYAVYAFAYNMLSLITTAIAAISTVIYPILKRSTKENLKDTYSNLVKIILVLVSTCLLVYFPLQWFVNWFLPNYRSSIVIFRIILPGLSISSVVTIVMHNYYKTDGKEVLFFIKSIIILFLSGIANYVAFFLFKTTLAISIASVIVLVAWYILTEIYIIKEYKVGWFRNLAYMLSITLGFYIITIWEKWWAAMLLYLLFLCTITILFYFKEISNLLKPKQGV